MTTQSHLHWLPPLADADTSLRLRTRFPDASARLPHIVEAAQHTLDFVQTAKLDRILGTTLTEVPSAAAALSPLKLAWLASSTVDHLVPATRIAGLRRGLLVESYIAPFNQYHQELLDEASALARFAPHAVLFSIDAGELLPALPFSASAAEANAAIDARVGDLRSLWAKARARSHCIVIQQTVADVGTSIFGSFDRLVPASAASLTAALNRAIAEAAAEDGVLLLDIDAAATRLGKETWFDPVRWHQGKQLVSPVMAPLYGELLARVVAAARGLSRKCLVLDLDNTLWGGVVGDDGQDNLVLGQGSAAGEAFSAFQRAVKQLQDRGVVLAVCSKNDHDIALAAFESHPEMILKRSDVAAFVANWDDKATNLRRIAETLGLGLESLVFFDDNPAERALVRAHLPMVAVPEVPEEPALYARCLADAGYFEASAFTNDDRERASRYHDNALRDAQKHAAPGDLDGYLEGLRMTMAVGAFDDADVPRVTQLINKTNQFNLTTRRTTEAEVRATRAISSAICLHFRLGDAFGDNGIVSVVIAQREADATFVIDTWLMSCRVLGRGVELAVMNVLADAVRRAGGRTIVGEYLPTAKNGLVRDHYAKLGFATVAVDHAGVGSSRWSLLLDAYAPHPVHIAIQGPLG